MGKAARWEWPAGKLDPGEDPLEAARREFAEETGVKLPADAEQVGTWTSEDGEFQGFVFRIAHEDDVELGQPDGDEISAIAWWDLDDLNEPEVREKVRENLDRTEPILERAEKDIIDTGSVIPRPGPGGHREEPIVRHHLAPIQRGLARQVNPTKVAGQFVALSGGAQMAGGALAAASGVVTEGESFAATLHISVTALEVALVALWANAWLAGAKDGRDSLDQIGRWVPGDDALDRAIEAVEWESWTAGTPPPASSLPGFDDVRQHIGALLTEIAETTRRRIAKVVDAFVPERRNPAEWARVDRRALATALRAVLDDPARAMLITRTEVNRAFTAAAEELFKRSAIAMFDLVPHPTACANCKDIAAANPHPIGDASATPPIHPACRCGVRPVVV